MLALRSQLIAITVAAFSVAVVKAETHTVSFVNNCEFISFPVLIQDGHPLGLDEHNTYISDGPIIDAYAYLETGDLLPECGENGAGCTTFEFTLQNGNSSASIYVPNGYNVPGGFQFYNGFYNGCDGSFNCTNEECGAAQIVDQVNCSADNADIRFTFSC